MAERMPGWVRALLALYPRALRRSHSAEIAEYLRIERERRSGEGLVVRARFVLGVVVDLVRGAARAHAHARAGVRRHRGGGGSDPLRELRFAGRSLRRSPGFAATVVGTLALGIGLSTAVFSALDAVLLRPLPYAQPDRLVRVTATLAGTEGVSLAGRTVEKMRERTRSLEDLAGVAVIRQNMTGVGLARQVDVGWSTTNLFDLLGVRALLGRTFRADDPMGTAVLSYGSWQRDFGGDPAVVGRTVRLDGYGYTIAGVLPASFALHQNRVPRAIDVWKVPDTWWQNGDIWNSEGSEFGLLRVIGRLADGADVAAARADLARVADGLRGEVASYEHDDLRLTAEPLHAYVVSRARPILLLLMAAVVAVVLIACANVAGLLLVRAEDRAHDATVRRALGASRGRIVLHGVAESALLAFSGGVLGVLLAAAGTRVLPRIAPASVPRLEEVSLDARVLAFAALVTLSCTLLAGVAPALWSARRTASAVPGGTRTTADRRRARGRTVLVAAQIAASLVLVVCAGLLAGSLGRLEDVDPGIRADGVVTFAISLPGARYGWPEETDLFFRRLEERLRALPGVMQAGVVWPLPLSGTFWDGGFHGGAVREEDQRMARYALATPTLFETLGIRVDGRTFGADDPKRAVIVSRSLAERAWPDGDAIGRTLRAQPWGQDTVHFEVIGVTDDVHYESVRDGPTDVIYFHSAGYAWTDWEVDVVLRTTEDVASLAPRIRAEVAAMDGEIPVARLRTLRSLVDAELATNRFARLVFGVFAAVAAGLSLLGLYGVTSYGVRSRRREFGIRMALGSGAGSILRLVVRSGLLVALAGVVPGLLLASWAAGLLRGLLFGVTPHEPWFYAAAALAMAAVAVAASVLPARRAARLDPASVLRSE